MISDGLIIRELRASDNAQLARVIRSVLVEHKVPQIGTTYADPVLDSLFDYYNRPRSGYYVVEKNGIVMGGAGITGLENYDGNVCELQKMYFLKEIRGSGIGSRMLGNCLDLAENQGYDYCYLETMPYMKKAQQLYLKNGFEYLEGPLGDTGHYSCTVWMLKKFSQTKSDNLPPLCS